MMIVEFSFLEAAHVFGFYGYPHEVVDRNSNQHASSLVENFFFQLWILEKKKEKEKNNDYDFLFVFFFL